MMNNKFKNSVIAIFMLIAFPKSVLAQFEIGAGIGATNFQGDLGGTLNNGAYKFWDLDLYSTREMAQVFGKYALAPNLKLRGNFAYAHIYGNDEYAGNPEIAERGVKMDGQVLQGNVQIEFNLSSNSPIYGIVGLGVSRYNVETAIHGVNQQNKPSNSFNVPIGIGMKIAQVGIGQLNLEVVAHYLNTDYADGYAGPNSYSNDTYTFLSVNYSIPLGNHKFKYGPPKNKKMIQFNKRKCPGF